MPASPASLSSILITSLSSTNAWASDLASLTKTSVKDIDPSVNTAISVVPQPISIRQTPSSLSSLVKTE